MSLRESPSIAWSVAVLAIALSFGCSKRPASVRTTPPLFSAAPSKASHESTIDTSALTLHLVRRIEATAGSVENLCTRGRFLLEALPHAQALERDRVLRSLKDIAGARAVPHAGPPAGRALRAAP